MNKELKEYNENIKRKHSFGWKPKYSETFETCLNEKVFVHLAIKTIENIGWDLIFKSENSIEAKRKGDWDIWTEKITISLDTGIVTVKSVTLENNFWDTGNNSKRVKLFIYAFQIAEKQLNQDTIANLEEEIEKENNWDDYEVPKSLPLPKNLKKPDIKIPILIGLLTSLILGFLIAFISFKGFYIIGLVEIIAAIIIGFALKKAIKLSNYTNYFSLNYLLISMIVITYLSNLFFQYHLILNSGNYDAIGFVKFIQLLLQNGLTVKSMNLGKVGLILSWIFQLICTYFLGVFKLSTSLTQYIIDKIPNEVIEFTTYHFIKEKSIDQVREELAKMGWNKAEDQNDVFNAIETIQGIAALRREA